MIFENNVLLLINISITYNNKLKIHCNDYHKQYQLLNIAKMASGAIAFWLMTPVATIRIRPGHWNLRNLDLFQMFRHQW